MDTLTPTFATLMAEERTRIHDAIKEAKAKRQEVDREMQASRRRTRRS